MKALSKRTVVIGALVAAVFGATAFTRPANEFKNLKVLPKDISDKQLKKIMVDDFNDGLGVSCTFCHAENKDTHEPDYASDTNPEKDRAREMMRMALDINKNYFSVPNPVIGDSSLIVTCITCHKGKVYPDNQ
ncbi:MAG: c-type cytochrome [Bacteroidetes bacterium]|nr:c-type cytochrome [Bacteroidota bacterium]